MLKIESIQNGIVIDHIPAGKGMDIYKLLELDSQKQSIALLQSVRSEKYGCKGGKKISSCSAKNFKKCNQMQKSPLHYQYGSKLRAHLQIVLQWKI